ncbi:MAG: M20 aminoacylase family protein [Orrella sp.]
MLARSPLSTIYKFQDEMIALRRDLHANPEIGFKEKRTSSIVAGALLALGIEVHRNVGGTGVVGVLRGKQCNSGLSIGLRADMDALPMCEDSGLSYASQHDGLMHACGHDGHTTILLAAAKYLAQTRDFNGQVVFIFQPAEEGLGGAQAMIEDGLFERFHCDAIYALHNWPALPAGRVGINPGPMMAASDRFEILVQGKGGHGAHPYQTIDPILVGAHIVTALQSIVSRTVNPHDSAVISVGSLIAGNPNAMSVIPDQPRLVGTVRTFRDAVQKTIEEHMQVMVQNVASAFGATAELKYQKLYAPTINNPECAQRVVNVATDLFGAENVVSDLTPSMGSEDFSFMLQHRPGAYFRLGQGGADQGRLLHNPQYDFNDAVIPLGATLFARLVETEMLIEPNLNDLEKSGDTTNLNHHHT